MKTSPITKRKGAKAAIGRVVLVGCTFLAGCATESAVLGSGTNTVASDQARMTRSGFLSDYARLRPTPWGEGIECWRDPSLDARSYNKVLISRILVSLKVKTADQTFDPKDIKTLTDYFHQDLVKALQPQMPVVDQAGPGVVVLRGVQP